MSEIAAEVQVIIDKTLKGYVSKEECEKAQLACQKVNCLELKMVKNDVGTVKKLLWTVIGILVGLGIGAIFFYVQLAQKIVEKGII